jgi:AraC-like DNA-binding protein
MICKRIKPSLFLHDYIKEYVLIDMLFDAKQSAPVKAYPTNPEEGMSFQIKGFHLSESPELNFIEKNAKSYIFGQPDTRQNLHISHEFMKVHVRFQPGALFRLLQIPMNELVHKRIDGELILGAEMREISEKLANAPDYEAIPLILNQFFTKKVKQIKYQIQPIDSIGRLILENPQGFNLEKIANEACLSRRQFEKRFVKQIGVTPKYYARICRFYQAYALKDAQPDLDWLYIAVNTGYTDYQHLVKDFTKFAGTKPNSLIEESRQNPERLLNIAEFRGV